MTPKHRALESKKDGSGKRMLATGKIEPVEGYANKTIYRATIKTKKGEFKGDSYHRPLALSQALYESKRTKKNPHPGGKDINLMK